MRNMSARSPLLVSILAGSLAYGVPPGHPPAPEGNPPFLTTTIKTQPPQNLSNLGDMVYTYKNENGIIRPSEAYLQLFPDAIKTIPGKESVRDHQQRMDWASDILLGATLGGILGNIYFYGGIKDKYEMSTSYLATQALMGIATLGASLYTYAESQKLKKVWQQIPAQLKVEGRTVVREEFQFLYPPGTPLKYKAPPQLILNCFLWAAGGAVVQGLLSAFVYPAAYEKIWGSPVSQA